MEQNTEHGSTTAELRAPAGIQCLCIRVQAGLGRYHGQCEEREESSKGKIIGDAQCGARLVG